MAKNRGILDAFQAALIDLIGEPQGTFEERKKAYREWLTGEAYTAAGQDIPSRKEKPSPEAVPRPSREPRRTAREEMPLRAAHGSEREQEEIHEKAMSAAGRWKSRLDKAARRERRGGNPTGDSTMTVSKGGRKRSPRKGVPWQDDLIREVEKGIQRRTPRKILPAEARPTLEGPVMVSDAARSALRNYPEGYDEQKWKRRKFAMR